MLRTPLILALVSSLVSTQAAVLSSASESPRRMAEQASTDPAEFEAALNKLHELGVVAEPQYWLENVKPGKFIPSTEIQPLVIAAANKFETVTTIEEALEVLNKQKVLMNREKWNDLATKPKVASGVVFLLIMAMAKSIN